MTSINCRGRLLSFDTSIVMGVINLTPDSFYAGSRFLEYDKLEVVVSKMIEDGAKIIDIGGMSSRPGAAIVDKTEELRRVLEPLKLIRKLFPHIMLSLDTLNSEVAHICLAEGVDIINDISGAEFDSKMINEVVQANAGYVLMHMKGLPENMQDSPQYASVAIEILNFLKDKIYFLREQGLENIIIDPGFGFGKTLMHNYKILKNLELFKVLDCPILVGLSRKRMIQEVISKEAEDALNGTTAAHILALQNGANILRAHDVLAASEAIKIWSYYNDVN